MCLNRQSALKNSDACSRRPTVPDDPTLPNIMVLGPMGSGVSSVVNLIAGKEVSRVPNDTSRCTKKMASHRVQLVDGAKTVPVTLYDIPGFDYNSKSPLEFPHVPISLAIICLEDFPEQVRATAEYLQHRWKRHGAGIPVVVVVNNTASKLDPDWWQENKKQFPSLSVVTDHVCVTERKKEESTRQLHSLIIRHLSAHRVRDRARASPVVNSR